MNPMEANVFDRLLYYLSDVEKLRWEDFKEAIKILTGNQPDFARSTYLTALARLGHLDYDPLELSYVTIAPAVLVETQAENRYVLVGSRTPGFLEQVRKCISENGGKSQVVPEKYGPTTVILSELTEEIFPTLESLGIHISWDFSTRLSYILPRPKFTNLQSEPDSLVNAEKKFNPTTLDYESVDTGERTSGLYQISQHGPNIYVLKSGTSEKIVPRDWAEWYVLSGKSGLITYKKKTQIWRVRNELRVPLIVDRCATLCSGFPRKLRGDFFLYCNVPVEIAERLAKSLYQNLEII